MEATEQEIYDQSIGEQTENVPETPQEATTEAVTERARDEKGRFATSTPEPTSQEAPAAQEVAPQPEAETHQDARVPSWRLAEEATRRREAEQALAEIRNEFRQMQMQMMHQRQPQQEAPVEQEIDIFADPQGFVQRMQNSYEQRFKAIQLENSLRWAASAVGEQKFNEAYNEFTDHVRKTQDQATYQRVMASPDPGQALVKWHSDQQLHKQLGGSDLQSFIEKQRDEWLKDPAVQAKVIEAFKATQQAQSPSNTLTNLPPSLSKATASRSSHDDGGNSGADIYSYATAKR